MTDGQWTNFCQRLVKRGENKARRSFAIVNKIKRFDFPMKRKEKRKKPEKTIIIDYDERRRLHETRTNFSRDILLDRAGYEVCELASVQESR